MNIFKVRNSDIGRPFTEIVTLSEPKKATHAKKGRSKKLTGVPREPGAYLVSLSEYHTNGLVVLPDDSLIFYPSDMEVSQFVLTEEHLYVQEQFGHNSRYHAMWLVLADQKRAR